MSDTAANVVEEKGSGVPKTADSTSLDLKTTDHGVVLIPQPSDDETDPLVRSCCCWLFPTRHDWARLTVCCGHRTGASPRRSPSC